MSALSAVAQRADAAGLGRQRRHGLSVVDGLRAIRTSVRIPIARLSADPGNVRDDNMGDVEGLADTIRAEGIYQALLVCTVAAYNDRDHDEVLVDPGLYDYVVLDGHRRREAALLAGLAEVPAEVHDEWAGASKTKLQLITAMHGQRLSPVAFAEGIRDVRAAYQLRQVDVGPFLGLQLDQSTVSRYEQLLGYPDFLKDLLRTDALTVDAARALASLPDEDAMRSAYALMTRTDDVQLSAGSAVETVRLELQHAANAEASAGRLADYAVTVVDPAAQWGSRAGLHHLAHDELGGAIDREHRPCLAAAVSTEDGLIDWYCTDLARHGVLDDDAEARRARRHRERAVTTLVHSWPGVPAASYELADGIIAASRPGTPLRLAVGWAKDAGLLPPEVADREPPQVIEWVTWRLTGESRVKFARLLGIAGDEAAARRPGECGPRQKAYLQRLGEETSYQPTPWENDRINRLDDPEVTS